MSSEAMPTREPLPLVRNSVLAAHTAIVSLIHRTPVLTSSSLSESLPGRNTLYFKAENLQKGGAFKFRGASYSLSCLTPDQLARGVCTHSSGTADVFADWHSNRMGVCTHHIVHFIDPAGNHAGALALAAKQRGVKCYVVMVRVSVSSTAQPFCIDS